ncbi:hypothetical protein JY651_07385 [Pyxidicoccus parkwayensis]|uniref:MORN repeat-containing protein n=1 Tax=Pyxidicoccus parkwayensis TaxID=2813578 RepID=A0ABX7P2R3_9BACT|nr:hypothetical protein [Pyxidicoccus parkwaysis]QSQ24759.1 hypothetical protein JY651_07385 [Pyxidicoccus parkwaysis]
MFKNVSFNVVALSLALAVPAVGAAAQSDEIQLSCPAGTKQFGGRATMTDRGVFCVKQKAEAHLPIAHGPYVSFHPNGQKKAVGQHSNGAQTGLWTFFDENGVKTEEIEFSGGNYHGKRTQFFGTGQKKLEEHWVSGKREGTAVAYSENGQKVSEFEYQGGHLVKQNGQPVASK